MVFFILSFIRIYRYRFSPRFFFYTFFLQRIRKNLKDGIVAWSPIAVAKRAIVDFPTRDIDSEMRADHVRSSYIRDTIVNMLEYSGVKVSSTMCNDQVK